VCASHTRSRGRRNSSSSSQSSPAGARAARRGGGEGRSKKSGHRQPGLFFFPVAREPTTVAARRRSTGEGGPEPVDGRMRCMVVSPSSARTSSAFLRLAAGPDARGRAPVVARGTAFGAAAAAGSVEGCGPVIARRSHDAESCSDASSSLDSSAALITVDARGFASGALAPRALARDAGGSFAYCTSVFEKNEKLDVESPEANAASHNLTRARGAVGGSGPWSGSAMCWSSPGGRRTR
jgi:hypothetical protein